VEIISNGEMCEFRWKFVDARVEMNSSSEVCETEREFFKWLVKMPGVRV
jgi:hypothetical protein